MPVFKDRFGAEWLVEINVAQVKRIRQVHKFDLGKLIENEARPLKDLLEDTIRLVDTVYMLVQPQADERGISDVKFGESISGESLEGLSDAFINALIDFFPPSQSQLLRKMVEKGRQAQRILAERLQIRVNEINPEQLADNILTSSKSPANSQA